LTGAGRLPLRRRVALLAAAAVAIAVVIAALVCYWVVRTQLRDQVDTALQAQAVAVQQHQLQLGQPLPGIPPSAGGSAQYYQVVNSTGQVLGGSLPLPVDSQVVAVANGRAGAQITDVQVGGSSLRELVFPATFRVGLLGVESGAIQLARPLDGVNHILSNLRLVLILLCVGGVALAAALGRLAGRRALAPLAEVAQTAQHISETEDLTSRIHVRHDDEVGQLATRFNAMIERLQSSRDELDESVRAQRQLVADASHELRTPVTSLRTNIEVLLEGPELREEDRERLLADVVEQSEELSALIGDLIELARGDLPVSAADEARLDRIVAESVARARRNSPTIHFAPELAPVVVDGIADRLARAVNNLLDNAARHSRPDDVVEVKVDEHGVTVRDHGPGIDQADLPHVFDRFYRGANSRGLQGSGLGLAIVRQVAVQHGGSVRAANAPDGGAIFQMHLPVVTAEEPQSAESVEQNDARSGHSRTKLGAGRGRSR
jgi:two-component system, OmpR family, sensor histidine kinase MprB